MFCKMLGCLVQIRVARGTYFHFNNFEIQWFFFKLVWFEIQLLSWQFFAGLTPLWLPQIAGAVMNSLWDTCRVEHSDSKWLQLLESWSKGAAGNPAGICPMVLCYCLPSPWYITCYHTMAFNMHSTIANQLASNTPHIHINIINT